MALADEFQVSRVTVRRTLEMLQRDRLVERRRGVGTFAMKAGAGRAGPLSGVLENLITIGLDTHAETVAFGHAAPPARVAAALGVEAGSSCLMIERRRFHAEQPVSLTTVWVPPAFADRVREADLGDRPVITILETSGLRAASADQTLSAVLADDLSAGLLATSIGAPLIRLRRTVLDHEGGALLHQQSLYVPERYEYHMLLTRDNSSARPQWRHIG
jgi:GntR family transcriptional regulator